MPFTPYIIAVNEIVSVNGALWTNTGTETGPIFSAITLTSLSGSTWGLSSNYPNMASGRNITLQGFGSNGWYDMWRGTEDDLPIEINLLGLPFSDVRVKYTLGNYCVYYGISTPVTTCESGGGINPVGCIFPRDHDCQDHDTLDHS